jgi:hypothetical protein
MRRALLLLLSVAACGRGSSVLVHDFPVVSASSGEEIVDLCESWTLHNADELWINAVELEQDQAAHHSNWTYVPEDKYPGPDGVWPCVDRGYDRLLAALAGGVLYAQSTEVMHEVQKFPNNGALRIPPHARVIGDVHILNASPRPIAGHARLSMVPLPAVDVRVRLAPFHLGFSGLEVPPRALSRNQASCDLSGAFQAAAGRPLDAKVYYILPHYHSMGSEFFVDIFGGARDGASIFDATGPAGEALGRAIDPPADLTGASGIHFGCQFDNQTDVDVHYGNGQEMCELLGYADASMIWVSIIKAVGPDASASDMPTFTGPCDTQAYPYDFTTQ